MTGFILVVLSLFSPIFKTRHQRKVEYVNVLDLSQKCQNEITCSSRASLNRYLGDRFHVHTYVSHKGRKERREKKINSTICQYIFETILYILKCVV